MEQNTKVHQLALALVTGVGTSIARNLIRLTGSVSGIFRENANALVKIPGITERVIKQMSDGGIIRRAEEEIRFMEKEKIRMLFFTDPEYPELLKFCQDAPLVLFVKGNLPQSMPHSLSVIGTRNPSSRGRQLTRDWVGSLAKSHNNLHIISGLAYGIDITGHEAALENKLITLAVLGHGFHTLYPSVHRAAAERILEKGALITDFFSYNRREPKNFIRRNRIIAGISEATLVIESAFKGGAMATAEMANSYDREVFTVPGRPGDETSVGCNYLIRSHQAILVNSPDDIPFQLNWQTTNKIAFTNQQKHLSTKHDLTETQQRIIDSLSLEALSLDELSYQLKLLPAQLTGELLTLEFTGLVEVAPGKRFKLL
ncbi:MAG: DNA-protecting protein DprA [Bacteroidetes bacterium]|jgi:DNA processing protein|nr:DNA-protecting protein DprA [Bacteroidota bacterium]MBT3749726.1 DNA-protecting protein DprA [Bacteroidota bacterium]MBT4401981.1 DNA-protecting protein DprA [Bacteroidota bacterium]MBT4412241.1 DNA-protecting protein DprA [Bacteroidota bacterium]MBT5427251.1 DNA-protecting protein DprA [Bacteroidota bacterium]